MEFRHIREEHAVDHVISVLKESGASGAKVKLGELRGSPEPFGELFAYLTKGSRLEGARVTVESIPAVIECMLCDFRGSPDLGAADLACPKCQGKDIVVRQGSEMEVRI